MSTPQKNILIGTTLSQGSDEVVQAGFGHAGLSGAVVHLGHAVPPFSAGDPALRRPFESLTQQAYRTGLDGIPFLLHVEPGLPHRMIERLAGELRPDLIVLGASEPAHPRPFSPGSTVDRVLRQAACPVLVVRPSRAFPPQRILIPVDVSAGATNALRHGMGWLRDFEDQMPGTELLFLLSPGESSVHVSVEEAARCAAGQTAHAGHTTEQILAEIAERKPDLVVLGPQGRSRLEHQMIGSVADEVLRESPTSVLVVPPEALRFEPESEAPTEADWR